MTARAVQSKRPPLIPIEKIEQAIYFIRGEKVMLDRNLALLYGVPVKALKQAVRRNIDRFPDDFMFVLSPTEFQDWRSQFVTSNADCKGLRYAPMAFTEHGILMLSSVLNSRRAIQVNIEIMRAFVQLRQMLASNSELRRRLDDVESKYDPARGPRSAPGTDHRLPVEKHPADSPRINQRYHLDLMLGASEDVFANIYTTKCGVR